MTLTESEINKAKARNEEYVLSDENGLYLVVKTTGEKLWFVEYLQLGKKRRRSLVLIPKIVWKTLVKNATKSSENLQQEVSYW